MQKSAHCHTSIWDDDKEGFELSFLRVDFTITCSLWSIVKLTFVLAVQMHIGRPPYTLVQTLSKKLAWRWMVASGPVTPGNSDHSTFSTGVHLDLKWWVISSDLTWGWYSYSKPNAVGSGGYISFHSFFCFFFFFVGGGGTPIFQNPPRTPTVSLIFGQWSWIQLIKRRQHTHQHWCQVFYSCPTPSQRS